MTSVASFGLGSTFTSCTLTVGALQVFMNFELFCDTVGNFLQIEFYLDSQVASLVHLWLCAASEAEASTSMSAKDIAEHREDVVHVHACAASESSESTLWTIESKLVVLLSLLRVAQYVVSLGGFLELFLCLLIVRIAVRVIFDGYLSVSLLDFIVGCRLVDAKHLVIVSLSHLLMLNSLCFIYSCSIVLRQL